MTGPITYMRIDPPEQHLPAIGDDHVDESFLSTPGTPRPPPGGRRHRARHGAPRHCCAGRRQPAVRSRSARSRARINAGTAGSATYVRDRHQEQRQPEHAPRCRSPGCPAAPPARSARPPPGPRRAGPALGPYPLTVNVALRCRRARTASTSRPPNFRATDPHRPPARSSVRGRADDHVRRSGRPSAFGDPDFDLGRNRVVGSAGELRGVRQLHRERDVGAPHWRRVRARSPHHRPAMPPSWRRLTSRSRSRSARQPDDRVRFAAGEGDDRTRFHRCRNLELGSGGELRRLGSLQHLGRDRSPHRGRRQLHDHGIAGRRHKLERRCRRAADRSP